MRKLLWLLLLAVPFSAGTSQAQLSPPNDAGVSMGHVHFVVQDAEAHKKFWVALGATPVKAGVLELMKFPGVVILVRKGEPTGGTVGSVVNHIAFNVPNTQEAMARWKAAGLKTEAGRSPQQGFVYTPDDLTRLEILENTSLQAPIAFHHIHLYVAAAAVPEAQAWYAKMFGAVPGKRGQNEAADLPGVNLTFSKSDAATAPTKGRMLDHIGFEVKGLEAFAKKAEAAGVKFDVPYTPRPDLGLSLAYVTDPWGTYIELTDGLSAF